MLCPLRGCKTTWRENTPAHKENSTPFIVQRCGVFASVFLYQRIIVRSLASVAFFFDARHGFHHRGGRQVHHQLAFHEIHVGSDVSEVALPSGAEIRVPHLPIFVRDEARTRAIAVAGKSPFAFLALPCEAFALVLPKLSLFRAVNHLGERFFVQIAELKFREHIVVAGIDVAVVFHRRGVSAGFGHRAQASRHAHPPRQCGIEKLHEESAHILAYPLVEKGAEKFAPGLGRHTEGRHFCRGEPFDGRSEEAAVGVAVKSLNNGCELQEVAADAFEEAVELQRLAYVVIVHHGHGIPVHAVAREQLDAVHHLPPRSASRARESVAIVHLFCPVDGDTHQKTVFGQETTPIVGEQGAIRLQCVLNVLARRVLLLQCQRLFVESARAHQRFPAVPSEEHAVSGLNGDVIVNVALECLVAHFLFGRFGVEFLLFEVITISTVQIAGRTGGFGHDVYGVHGAKGVAPQRTEEGSRRRALNKACDCVRMRDTDADTRRVKFGKNRTA